MTKKEEWTQPGAVHRVQRACGCDGWTAKQYLIAEEGNEAEAITSYRTDIGLICPSCDSKDTESNGCASSPEYRCRECDDRWGWDNGEKYNC